MQYVVSDLRGCHDKYLCLLDRLALQQEDRLYILGNMLGYGPEGLRILRSAAANPCVVPLLGTQEFSAMVCLPWLQEELEEGATRDDVLAARLQQVLSWKAEGGESVMAEFALLSLPEQLQVLNDLSALPVFRELEAGGRRFILVHGGLDNFSPGRPLSDYRLDELILATPDPDKTYFTDRYLVFGHTPTPMLGGERAEGRLRLYPSGIFRSGMLIGIDCGCGCGGRLGCLCLDTFEEFYIDDPPCTALV